MHAETAELSAIATSLEELTRRLTAIADRHAASPEEELAAQLHEVERSLAAAIRRLARIQRDLR